MRREVSISELEPTLVVEAPQRSETCMGIAFETPSVHTPDTIREGVGDRIEVGRHVQAEEVVIVGRIDDQGQPFRFKKRAQSPQKPCCPDPPGQDCDPSATGRST